MTEEEENELIAKVRAVIEPYGCKLTGLGPNTVGVQGDARAYGPCAYVEFPAGMDWDEISRISNEITNQVPGITRVTKEIARKD